MRTYVLRPETQEQFFTATAGSAPARTAAGEFLGCKRPAWALGFTVLIQ